MAGVKQNGQTHAKSKIFNMCLTFSWTQDIIELSVI